MTVTITRQDFIAALNVIDEGRGVHAAREIDRAKAVLKPVAQYQWAQIAMLAFCFLALVALSRPLHLNWPWSGDLILCGFAGALAARAIMHIPRIRLVFAPHGFEIDDVTEAARHVFA